MTDTHDVEHHFERVDQSRGKGYVPEGNTGWAACPFHGLMSVSLFLRFDTCRRNRPF